MGLNPYESPAADSERDEPKRHRLTFQGIAAGVLMVLGVYLLIFSLWAVLLAIGDSDAPATLRFALGGLFLASVFLGRRVSALET
jgi:hypothetical protein